MFLHTGEAVKRVCSSDVRSWSLSGVFFSVFTVRCLFLHRCERWTFSSAKTMAPLNHTYVGKSSTCKITVCSAYKTLQKICFGMNFYLLVLTGTGLSEAKRINKATGQVVFVLPVLSWLM